MTRIFTAFLAYIVAMIVNIVRSPSHLLVKALKLTWFLAQCLILIPLGFVVGFIGGALWFLWDVIADAFAHHRDRKLYRYTPDAEDQRKH